MKKFWHNPVPAAYLCSATVALLSYPVLLLFLTRHPLVAGVASGVVGGLANWMRINYLASLHRRAGDNNEIVWDVQVNAVKVGTISDADYAAIRAQAFSDIRNYAAQFFNALKVAVRSIDKIVIEVPLVIFWGGVGLAVFAPEQFSTVVASVQNGGPGGIAMAAKSGLQIMLVVWLMAIGANMIFGARLGFVNRFDADIATRLRVRLGVAADGRVSVLRWVDGEPMFNDEMAFARGRARARARAKKSRT